ncbi:hypothetical protein [Rubrobacter radiotolerans]|uniref:Uncharacterized protein n=1 Tax=Rubrobacter radiotolerans TaxID=42256 RepID=A0AB35T7V0_RUBRA|nr:hypothetical protein [Rubrobacter radiotolerans]MDX5895181.1 hypothetical protein [Rubrobacter radiotolerans]SMC07605.1 hypothetical protein SAMN00767673_2496 [Rubrobacter radiotolerans DSM 5868]
MSLPNGGFERRDRPGKRRVVVWLAVGTVLVIGWVGIVLGWNTKPSQDATVQNQRTDISTVPEGPAFAQGTGITEPETPAEPAEPVEGVPVENLESREGGADNEPGVYDPIGTGALAGDLSRTDEERVRYAAEKFVMAAYGYTGSDEAEYLAGVAAVSLSPDLSLSPGGAEISLYARQVEESGTKSAAILTDFELKNTSQETVNGTVIFETGEAYSPGGDLVGERLYYRQEMTLTRMGESWKVRAAEVVQESEAISEEGG